MTNNGLDHETPAHDATDVSEKENRAKQLKEVGALVRQMLVILYPIGTILGLIYAHWYYKAFEISFLNHVTPLDLLLVALANANKITFIFAVTVPLTIMALLVLYFLVVARWGLTVFVAALIVVAKLVKVLWAVLAVGMRHVLVAVALVSNLAVAFFTLPVVAFSKGRTVALDWWRERATDRNGSISKRLRNSMHWWRLTRSRAKGARRSLRGKFSDFVKEARCLFSRAKSIRTRGIVFLGENRVGVFLLVLVVTSVFVAYKSGKVDSKCVLEDKSFCNLGFGDLLDYGERLISDDDGEGDLVSSGKAIVVPTVNVAALEFLDGDSDGGRKHVRVTIRQGEGNHSFPRCLTDIGATDSAQFLFDFDNDNKERFAGRDECWSELSADGGCGRTASIPFSRGSATLDGKSDQRMDVAQSCTPRSGCTGRSERCSSFDCLVEIINAKAADGLIPAKLRLIGRADSLPINNGSFRSNDGLAQARAEEVWKRLRSRGWKWLDDVDVLRLIGGPLSPFYCDVCDRSVDVHICWEPAEEAGRTGGGG